MFEELKGNNGCIVGTEKYFKELNRKYHFSKLISINQHNYKESLVKLCGNIKKSLDEIYRDLENNAKYLRYIQEAFRNNLEKYVLSLNNVCKLYDSEYNNISSIISLLTLNQRSTKLKSDASENQLFEAVSFVKSNSYLNESAGVNLLETAIFWDEEYAIGDELDNLLFILEIDEIFENCDKDFYDDILTCIKASSYSYTLKGICSKYICSNEYMEYFEKEIFGKTIMNSNYKGHNDFIKNALENIKNEIESDILHAISSDKYVIYENRQNIKNLAKSLKDVKVSSLNVLEYDIDKLKRLEDFDNKVIEINKTGNSYPVEAELKWENGENILNINAKIKLHINNEMYKSSVIKGFESWSGNYEVFNNQKIKVVVKVINVTIKDRLLNLVLQQNFYKINPSLKNLISVLQNSSIKTVQVFDSNKKNTRGTGFGGGDLSGFWGWGDSTILPKGVLLSSEDGFIDSDIAKHEFGHMLGLGDLYDDSGLGLPGVPHGTYQDLLQSQLADNLNYNLVMDNNGTITNNDIEMVIRAFQTGERQNYQTQDFWLSQIGQDEISDVLGKGN